jgi:hypothetical protein
MVKDDKVGKFLKRHYVGHCDVDMRIILKFTLQNQDISEAD